MLYAGHLCSSDLSREQIRRFSEKILSRLNHLEQQVKDMLIFVKGDVKLTDNISLATLFQSLEVAMDIPVQSARSSYQMDNQCPDVQLHCNRDSMVGALMNLVNNALQSQGGEVEINVRAMMLNSQQLEIMVCDNGPGIPDKVIANLEEPFYSTKPQGTGLGLAVVRAVIHAHQGEFQISSEPGLGTCCRLLLPVLAPEVSGGGEPE